jgi:prepilin-type N-terminal cleavage/methylation domain-containing protein/prepilin-type processing-associated H-X9-DG protein
MVSRNGRLCGFTLIELLIVVAVLGILAGLLLPVLARARDRAHRGACLARLRQIGQAYSLYVQDWDEACPPWRFSAWPGQDPCGQFPFVAWCHLSDFAGPGWTEYLQPYLRSTGLLRDSGLPAPPTAGAGIRLADYVLLTWGPGGQGTRENPYWCWVGPGLSMAGVRRPAGTVLLTEGATTSQTAWVETGRHGGGVNAAFLDGHARWLPPGEFTRAEPDELDLYRLVYGSADR